jgi:hypothetical protein
MYETITAQFPMDKLRVNFLGNIFIFTLIGWIAVTLLGLFLVMFLLQHHIQVPLQRFPRPIGILLLIGMAVPGFLFGLWFAKKEMNKGCWQLTSTELQCGTHGQQKFPLSSIEKIIVGLPATNAVVKVLQKAKRGTALGTTVDVLSTIQPILNTARNLSVAGAIKDNSLLICFKDGSWLPLRLFALPDGRALMDALRERCKDRVIESHNFSPEELKRLRRRDPNELIPAPKNRNLQPDELTEIRR